MLVQLIAYVVASLFNRVRHESGADHLAGFGAIGLDRRAGEDLEKESLS